MMSRHLNCCLDKSVLIFFKTMKLVSMLSEQNVFGETELCKCNLVLFPELKIYLKGKILRCRGY